MTNDNTYTTPTISYLGEETSGLETRAVAAVAVGVGAVVIAARYARAFAGV